MNTFIHPVRKRQLLFGQVKYLTILRVPYLQQALFKGHKVTKDHTFYIMTGISIVNEKGVIVIYGLFQKMAPVLLKRPQTLISMSVLILMVLV